jgi:hypothetical protein
MWVFKKHCVKRQRENTPEYNTYSDYFKYLVTVIVVFRKYAWIVPMKSHKGNCIVEPFCFIEVYSNPNNYGSIMVVKFSIATISEWLQNKYIDMYSTQNEMKPSIDVDFKGTKQKDSPAYT